MDKFPQKILVILGPTSTGKTDLGIGLAKELNGEIVACDSRQVYKKLDIGTGKMPGGKVTVKRGKGFWEIDGVKVWMYDAADPKRQYTVYDYVKDVNHVINGIIARGKLPIIVGGTGLYLKAILSGLPNLVIPRDFKLRKELGKLSLRKLQQKLQKLSPKKWERMNNSDRQNPRRLIRAIEIFILRMQSEGSSSTVEDSSLIVQNDKGVAQNDTLKIGLTAPRDILYQRIDERVVNRINQGMLKEAEKLHKGGLSFKRMKQLGLEYGVLADYLAGEIRETQGNQGLIKIMQGKIHGYARRQITWFNLEKDVVWFDITREDFLIEIDNLVSEWYDTRVEGCSGRFGR